MASHIVNSSFLICRCSTSGQYNSDPRHKSLVKLTASDPQIGVTNPVVLPIFSKSHLKHNASNNNNKLPFSVSGARSLATRRSLFTLMLGVLFGFCLAIVFVSEPSRSSWMPYGGHSHEAELRDPHNGNDLANAAGPIMDVG